MNSAELGKRIKEARLAKKMTQSELVGTFITRNMLSRIESGNACPSVKTLEYLAGRLDLPAGSLISDYGEVLKTQETSCERLIEAKRLYTQGDFDNAGKAAEELTDGDFSDEAAAILARCRLNQAQEAMKGGDNAKAAGLAKEAIKYSETGIYRSRDTQTQAVLLLDEAARKIIG